jgi:Fic family protein
LINKSHIETDTTFFPINLLSSLPRPIHNAHIFIVTRNIGNRSNKRNRYYGGGIHMAPTIRMERRLMARLTSKKATLDRYRPLSHSTAQRLHDDLRLLLTYHSNAIEGNTLSLRETQIVLEEGVTIDGHPLREYLEATNHAHAFDALSSLITQPINIEAILHLHRLVTGHILDEDQAGHFRRVPVYIRGAKLTPPPARDVPALMQQWVDWVNGKEGQQYEPVTRATIAHHGFEALHAFTDGNGRVGRLLLNLMLMQAGYPPALLLREWRTRYIQALGTADAGNYTSLLGIIGLAVEQSLDLYLQACEAAAAQEEYRTLAELAVQFSMDADYLGLLARQGRLDAIKRSSRWYATAEAVQRYQTEAAQGKRERVPQRRRQRKSSDTSSPE